MSDVEIYWQKLAEKFGIKTEFKELPTGAQHLVIQSINQLLFVLDKVKEQENA